MKLLILRVYFKGFYQLQSRYNAFNHSTKHLNDEICTLIQGSSEYRISRLLEKCNQKDDPFKIEISILTTGAMDLEFLKWMSRQIQNYYHYSI